MIMIMIENVVFFGPKKNEEGGCKKELKKGYFSAKSRGDVAFTIWWLFWLMYANHPLCLTSDLNWHHICICYPRKIPESIPSFINTQLMINHSSIKRRSPCRMYIYRHGVYCFLQHTLLLILVELLPLAFFPNILRWSHTGIAATDILRFTVFTIVFGSKMSASH